MVVDYAMNEGKIDTVYNIMDFMVAIENIPKIDRRKANSMAIVYMDGNILNIASASKVHISRSEIDS